MINDLENEAIAIMQKIGFGRSMQLAETAWRKSLGKYSGGELIVYCCASNMVECSGCKTARQNGEHCDWCCGAGRVTEKVAEVIEKTSKV